MGRFARKVKRKYRRSIVRYVTLTPRQFNNFLFPVIRDSDATKGDPETTVRLLRELKRVSTEVPLTPQEQRAAEQGAAFFPNRRIDEDVTLRLEADMQRVLLGIFNAKLQQFSLLSLEEAMEIRDLIRDATEDEEASTTE